MSSYGLYRPGSSYYSSPARSYGTTPNYGSYSSSYKKPSYASTSPAYGSSYAAPARERSVERGGYTSDYGKSGYTSDYGKSGYASDRNRTGYTSDYVKPYSSNYKSYSRPSIDYGRSLSRQGSISGRDSLSRQNSISRLEDEFSRRNSYGGYSRSQSREEMPNETKVNGIANSESKTKSGCKAPADFTSEESSSEEEETESESEEEEEGTCPTLNFSGPKILLVTRATSPEKDKLVVRSSVTTIATIVKEKKPRKIGFVPTAETGCQVKEEELPGRRQRFISSRPTSLFTSNYYPSSTSTRFPTRSYTARSNSLTSPSIDSNKKTPTDTSNHKQLKHQLSVDDGVGVGGFSRDASPNDSKPVLSRQESDEPNKDFRKSVLNMNLPDESIRDEYSRRQEEMRRRRQKNKLSADQGAVSSPDENDDDRDSGDTETKKKRYLKKSPSRSGLKLNDLGKCNSRSKMSGDNLRKSDSKSTVDAGISKCASYNRVHRRNREEQRAASSTSTSSSSSSSDEHKSSRTSRQRRRGGKTEGTEESEQITEKPQADDAPSVVVTKPSGDKESEPEQLPFPIKKDKSSESSLTSPGEVVHLPFPGVPKAPPPLEKVDSGRNVAISVNIADFIKPSAKQKSSSSSSSSSSEETSSEEEDDRSLLTPVVPVTVPSPVEQEPPQKVVSPPSSSSSSSSSEEESEEEEEDDKDEPCQSPTKNSGLSSVQKSATVIHVSEQQEKKEVEKSSSEEEESSEEESSEDEKKTEEKPSETPKTEKPDVDVKLEEEKKKSESESEESESEEESSEEEESTKEKPNNASSTVNATIAEQSKSSKSDESPEKKTDSRKSSIDGRKSSIDSRKSSSDEIKLGQKTQEEKSNSSQSLSLLIGKCTDIDEMLGSPSPVSPGSASVPTSASPVKGQPFKFQATQASTASPPSTKKEESSSSSSSEEEEEESSSSSSSSSEAIEVVDPSAVKVHESKTAQKPELEAYTEEIDSSAVRIREGRGLNPELQQLTEEIDSTSVKIRQPMHGHISKAPKHKVEEINHSTNKPFGTLDSRRSSKTDSSSSSSRKSSLITNDELTTKALALIEKLNSTTNRDLRRTLFSLKQVFQDEKDLVQPFVQNDGLSRLIEIGQNADQNHQNYILRALGQAMLYVDGMTGIKEHLDTLKWFYNLAASKYRTVAKMSLKLLLMFVEYSPTNALHLRDIVATFDKERGKPLWCNVMSLLKERENLDMELLVYCMSLINKIADGIPDQDGYYDFVDALEEQGMEKIIQFHLCKAGTDKNLLTQLQIYEAVLKREDGEDDGKPFPGELLVRQVSRSQEPGPNHERRKSRRFSATQFPVPSSPKTPSTPSSVPSFSVPSSPKTPSTPSSVPSFPVTSFPKTPSTPSTPPPPSPSIKKESTAPSWIRSRETTQQKEAPQPTPANDVIQLDDDTGITPGLRRRRERDARNRTLTGRNDPSAPTPADLQRQNSLPSPEVKEKPTFRTDRVTKPLLVSQQRSHFENQIEDEAKQIPKFTPNKLPTKTESTSSLLSRTNSQSGIKAPSPITSQQSKFEQKPTSMVPEFNRQNSSTVPVPTTPPTTTEGRSVYGIQNKSAVPYSPPVDNTNRRYSWNQTPKFPVEEPPKPQIRPETSVKDVQNRLITPSRTPAVTEPKNRFGGTVGAVDRAKSGLTSSSYGISRPEVKTAQTSTSYRVTSENLEWDELLQTLRRPLLINDLDFTDLGEDDDENILQRTVNSCGPGGPPPPPPPPGLGRSGMGGPPPPPPPFGGPPPPPPPPGGIGGPPPPPPGSAANPFGRGRSTAAPEPPPWIRKKPVQAPEPEAPKNKKKTVKLFWSEVREEPALMEKTGKKRTIWDELKPVPLDTQRIETLFESKTKDIMSKKVKDGNAKTEILVLDTKRSNAINIGMTKLPPARAIKAAIMKMDTTIMNREGIEKILTTMMPTEEEKKKISESQLANPDVPLGSAEQFLQTLASVSELEARLRLWAFRLDYEGMEKEVAEPLMDLKQAIVEIESSKTFRCVLSTLLSVGNFLNGVNAKGFNIDYLSKVPEVKDTVHKHSLLHHICTIVMEKFPESTDLYSEFGAVTRASKVDFDELAKNLEKMEAECKASWEHLKIVTKHDGIPITRSRLSDFLTDCAERIIVLGIIHRRVLNRFRKMLVFLGYNSRDISDAKPGMVCKVVSEFALEYRTSRERVQQQIEKAAAQREREKMKEKLMMAKEVERFRTKEQKDDQQLRQILCESDADDGKMTKWGSMINLRGRPKNSPAPGGLSRPNSVMMLDRSGYSTPYESTTDIDDEILESLVKTATAQPGTRTEPRTRKKARYADRKSLRRTLKGGLDMSEAVAS